MLTYKLTLNKVLTGIFLLSFTIFCKAQDATFSQYYSSSLYLNPAFAGAQPYLTLGLNSRTQWKSIITPYFTNQASLIIPIYKSTRETNIGGIGLSVYNDKAGSGNLQATGINLNMGYNVKISEKHILTLAVQGGIIQKQVSFGSFQWGSQYNSYIGYDASIDPGVTNVINQKMYPDFGAGFLYYANPGRNIREKGMGGFFGGSAYHLNQPDESLVTDQVSKLPMLYKAHAGIEFSVSEKFNFSPNGLFVMQNGAMQINSGLYMTYSFGNEESVVVPSAFIAGAWYRLQDSFIFSTGLGSKYYTLGFSYDLNNSSLRQNTLGRGAYEISLTIQKPRVKKETVIKRYQTPRI